MTIKSIHNQSLIDLSVQEYGSRWVEGVVAMLEHNDGLSLAAELQPGTDIIIPPITGQGGDLSLRYLKARGISVATGQYLPPPPPAPTNFTALAWDDTRVDLSWDDNSSNEEGFEIWRDDVLIHTTLVDVTEWSDEDVDPETTYHYKVRAKAPSGYSAFTDTEEVTTPYALVLTTTKTPTGGSPFNPSITYGGADTPQWIMPNGSKISGASLNVTDTTTGLDGTEKIVKLLFLNRNQVTVAYFASLALKGAYDFSGWALTDLQIQANGVNFTGLTLPVGTSFTRIWGWSNSGMSTLSFVGVNFNNASISFYSCSLENLVFDAGSTGQISILDAYSNNLSGSYNLDLLSFTNTCRIDLKSNDLTEFLYSQNFNRLYLSNNNLTELDLSGCTIYGTGAQLDIGDNPISNYTEFASQDASSTISSLKYYNLDGCLSGIWSDSGLRWASRATLWLADLGLTGISLTSVIGSLDNLQITDNLLLEDINCTVARDGQFGASTIISFNPLLETITGSGITGGSWQIWTYTISTNPNLISSIDLSDNNLYPVIKLSSISLNSLPILGTITLPVAPTGGVLGTLSINATSYSAVDITSMGAVFQVNNVVINLSNFPTTTADVNRLLVEIDGIASAGFTGRAITITGASPAPDGSAGGHNGTAAVASLVSKGFTVITN